MSDNPAEAMARRSDPDLWLDAAPDLSARNERRNSLIRARVRLGEIWWNPDTETYENV